MLHILVFGMMQQLPLSSVPDPVRRTWQASHTGASSWQAGPGHSYEAAFTARGVRTVIRYSNVGQVIETRTVIGSFDLPERVKTAVLKELRGYRILDTWRVDRRRGVPPQFVIDCNNISDALSIRFDEDGREASRAPRRR
ncbi:MAG TPA: hypothetical protein VGL65_07025 [Gemmatimonadales bacterium]|jgi:ribosomal protein S26